MLVCCQNSSQCDTLLNNTLLKRERKGEFTNNDKLVIFRLYFDSCRVSWIHHSCKVGNGIDDQI